MAGDGDAAGRDGDEVVVPEALLRTGPPAEALPAEGTRWRVPSGLLLGGLAVLGVAVGVRGWGAVDGEPGLAVVEFGVVEATAVGQIGDDAPTDVLSWGAVIGNGGSSTVEAPTFDLEALDGDGDVVETFVIRLAQLEAGATTGVGGVVDEPGAVDLRLVPMCSGRLREEDDEEVGDGDGDGIADGGDPGPGSVAVDRVEIGTTGDNAAVVRYRATSHYDGPVGRRTTSLVYRDADGRIVGGTEHLVPTSLQGTLDPGESVTEHVTASTRLDGVATVDVYTQPDVMTSSYC